MIPMGYDVNLIPGMQTRIAVQKLPPRKTKNTENMAQTFHFASPGSLSCMLPHPLYLGNPPINAPASKLQVDNKKRHYVRTKQGLKQDRPRAGSSTAMRMVSDEHEHWLTQDHFPEIREPVLSPTRLQASRYDRSKTKNKIHSDI